MRVERLLCPRGSARQSPETRPALLRLLTPRILLERCIRPLMVHRGLVLQRHQPHKRRGMYTDQRWPLFIVNGQHTSDAV